MDYFNKELPTITYEDSRQSYEDCDFDRNGLIGGDL